MLDMKRRDFIALGGSAALLLAVKVRRARAQQPAMPVGFLSGELPARLRAWSSSTVSTRPASSKAAM